MAGLTHRHTEVIIYLIIIVYYPFLMCIYTQTAMLVLCLVYWSCTCIVKDIPMHMEASGKCAFTITNRYKAIHIYASGLIKSACGFGLFNPGNDLRRELFT